MATNASVRAAVILIVEDEPAIADTLVYALKTEGFLPVHCLTGAAASEAMMEQVPDLVILDVGLPDCNGFDWCKALRKSSAVPVLFLTARNSEIDRVVGLEIGGDDYVSKPFSPREVTARVRAILRRGPAIVARDEAEVQGGAEAALLTIDEQTMAAVYCGQSLVLTRYEFRLLRVLAAQPNRVFSRDQLMESVWEDPGASLDRTVDAHVKTLRAKLKLIAEERAPIQTHRGMGYAWRPES